MVHADNVTELVIVTNTYANAYGHTVAHRVPHTDTYPYPVAITHAESVSCPYCNTESNRHAYSHTAARAIPDAAAERLLHDSGPKRGSDLGSSLTL